MIIYSNTNLAFRQDVESNHIADIIETNFIEKIGHRESPAEKTAWRNSMQYMERVLRNSKIKDDCGVLIEYTIPNTELDEEKEGPPHIPHVRFPGNSGILLSVFYK